MVKEVQIHSCLKSQLEELEKKAAEEVEAMLKFSLESPYPDPKNALKHVYAGLEVEDR
ncbi:MAG: hypothetical protein AB1798_11195 [Spirochaetota bacterium]